MSCRHPIVQMIFALLFVLLAAGMVGAATTPDGTAPPVYPDDAKNGPVLPFVGPNGLGLKKLTRSDVQIAFGKPEEVVSADKGRNHDEEPRNSTLRYPALGITFTVDAAHAYDANPPLAYAEVELPSNQRTPQGLYLGMPQEDAMPIIEAHYKKRGNIPLSWGYGGYVKGASVLASNHGWRVTQRANFVFREKRLYRMSFQLQPTPLVSFEQMRSVFNTLMAIVIVTLLVNAITVLKRRLGGWWERGRLALSGLMVVTGLAGIGLGVGSFSDWNPYVRMAGFFMAAYSAGLILWALRLLSNSANPSIAGAAGAVLLTIVVLAGLAKFV